VIPGSCERGTDVAFPGWVSTPQLQAADTPHSSGRFFTGFVLTGLAVLLMAWGFHAYDQLSAADREVRARWSQLESSYHHRLELVPPLVELVEGLPGVEVTPLATARAELVRLEGPDLSRTLEDDTRFQQLNAAQLDVDEALDALLVESREHVQGAEYRVLEHQLEALSARIDVERLRFNEAVREFNAVRLRFPAMFIARGAGAKFAEKPFVPLGS